MRAIHKSTACLLGIGFLFGLAQPSMARDLVIARASEQTSIDPDFARVAPNQTTANHIFDRLLLSDPNARPIPGLAVSWTNENPTTWLVHLRPGVKFHDGTNFTAADVVYSLKRAGSIANSPAPFNDALATLGDMQIVDDLTIRFTTKSPDPMFLQNIGQIFIVSAKATQDKASSDFRNATVAVGTGPYKFVSWTPGDRLILAANPDYWGAKPEYDHVTFRFVSNNAARVADLLAGEVDVIDQVPPNDLPRLKSSADVGVFSIATLRLIYLGMAEAENTPDITDIDGNKLPVNPLRDSRVRQAIALMIDRPLLAKAILQGQGEPIAQLVPQGVYGYDPNLNVTPADVGKAKTLLTQAGYPNGFGITVTGSNDRFPLDGQITQAIGQMLARGGLKVTKVSALPYAVYTPGALAGKYPLFIFSFGSVTGEAGRGLSYLFHTKDAARNLGGLNRMNYSNPTFDKAIDSAMQEFDSGKREAGLRGAAEIESADTPIVPLYLASQAWAARKGLVVTPRRDEETHAMDVHVAK